MDVSILNELKQNRLKRHVFPTAGPPTITILKEYDIVFSGTASFFNYNPI